MTLGTYPELGKPVGQDPLVCRFLRWVHRLRPPKSRQFLTWEVSSVFSYIRSWGKTKDLSLKRLILKTAFLVALVCFKRLADSCNMNMKEGFWQLNMLGFTCQPLGYGKTEFHNPATPLHIEPFLEDRRLCLVYHLVRLDRRFSKLRPAKETKFWLSSKTPHEPVSATTISRWLTEVIRGSGALSGQARDVRSAESSIAIQAGMVIRKVMKAADWHRISTMQRHYFKPQKLETVSDILRV